MLPSPFGLLIPMANDSVLQIAASWAEMTSYGHTFKFESIALQDIFLFAPVSAVRLHAIPLENSTRS